MNSCYHDRNVRPKITLSIFVQIFALGLLGLVYVVIHKLIDLYMCHVMKNYHHGFDKKY